MSVIDMDKCVKEATERVTPILKKYFKELFRSVRKGVVLDPVLDFLELAFIFELMASKKQDTDERIQEIKAKMAAIRKREGLKDNEGWELNDPDIPEDYKKLDEAWLQRKEEIIVSIMREYGADEMADLLMNDKQEFERRTESLLFTDHRLLSRDWRPKPTK